MLFSIFAVLAVDRATCTFAPKVRHDPVGKALEFSTGVAVCAGGVGKLKRGTP
jgi:hypothetical protein